MRPEGLLAFEARIHESGKQEPDMFTQVSLSVLKPSDRQRPTKHRGIIVGLTGDRQSTIGSVQV